MALFVSCFVLSDELLFGCCKIVAVLWLHEMQCCTPVNRVFLFQRKRNAPSVGHHLSGENLQQLCVLRLCRLFGGLNIDTFSSQI